MIAQSLIRGYLVGLGVCLMCGTARALRVGDEGINKCRQ